GGKNEYQLYNIYNFTDNQSDTSEVINTKDTSTQQINQKATMTDLEDIYATLADEPQKSKTVWNSSKSTPSSSFRVIEAVSVGRNKNYHMDILHYSPTGANSEEKRDVQFGSLKPQLAKFERPNFIITSSQGQKPGVKEQQQSDSIRTQDVRTDKNITHNSKEDTTLQKEYAEMKALFDEWHSRCSDPLSAKNAYTLRLQERMVAQLELVRKLCAQAPAEDIADCPPLPIPILPSAQKKRPQLSNYKFSPPTPISQFPQSLSTQQRKSPQTDYKSPNSNISFGYAHQTTITQQMVKPTAAATVSSSNEQQNARKDSNSSIDIRNNNNPKPEYNTISYGTTIQPKQNQPIYSNVQKTSAVFSNKTKATDWSKRKFECGSIDEKVWVTSTLRGESASSLKNQERQKRKEEAFERIQREIEAEVERHREMKKMHENVNKLATVEEKVDKDHRMSESAVEWKEEKPKKSVPVSSIVESSRKNFETKSSANHKLVSSAPPPLSSSTSSRRESEMKETEFEVKLKEEKPKKSVSVSSIVESSRKTFETKSSANHKLVSAAPPPWSSSTSQYSYKTTTTKKDFPPVKRINDHQVNGSQNSNRSELSNNRNETTIPKQISISAIAKNFDSKSTTSTSDESTKSCSRPSSTSNIKQVLQNVKLETHSANVEKPLKFQNYNHPSVMHQNSTNMNKNNANPSRNNVSEDHNGNGKSSSDDGDSKQPITTSIRSNEYDQEQQQFTIPKLKKVDRPVERVGIQLGFVRDDNPDYKPNQMLPSENSSSQQFSRYSSMPSFTNELDESSTPQVSISRSGPPPPPPPGPAPVISQLRLRDNPQSPRNYATSSRQQYRQSPSPNFNPLIAELRTVNFKPSAPNSPRPARANQPASSDLRESLMKEICDAGGTRCLKKVATPT
ncbi:unnamed protein product, partial [Anisakis simplex]|uniref:WH2 domain-containing protein n=1 Tax=Anisakis simplex TaxID=6269 RepID=A0A0M3K8X4_ANISI